MATGMAIMGFGGGAMIASPLSVMLMDAFRSINSIGVAETFLCMGAIYLIFMMFGVFTIRIPPLDWKPAGSMTTVKTPIENYSYVSADGAATKAHYSHACCHTRPVREPLN